MIVLHQFEISPFCDKVRRVLHVKGQPYEVREIPPSQTFARIRRINKVGKVPVIEHDGHVVSDSTDIAHYLERRFPEPRLIPDDPRERALCHMLEDWADESLYFYEMTMRFTWPDNAARWVPELVRSENAALRRVVGAVVPMSARTTVRAQGVGRKSRERVLADVEAHVEAVGGWLGSGEWLVGNRLTLADIGVFAQLFCIGGTPEGARILASSSAVSAWMSRVDRATAPRR